MRRLLLAFFTVGCSSSNEPQTCAGFSLGDQCLVISSVRARSGGSFHDLPLQSAKFGRLDADDAVLDVDAPAAEAIEITIDGVHASAMVQEGYQSWGFSGAVIIPADVPMAADGSIAAKAVSGDALDEATGVSYGAALLGDPGGAGLGIGAVGAGPTTAIAATKNGERTKVTILYGASREPLPDTKPSFFFVSKPRAKDALAGLGGAVKAPTFVPKRPPGGWFSWNELFDGVDENAVRAHVEVVATKLAPLGMKLVEIDDGWELAWGDWHANSKFPSGMDGVAKAIRDRGLVAGVWLAPFLVDTATAMDTSLFVRGSDGKPLVHKPSGTTKTYYMLDGTNPASMAIATEPIRELSSAGFTYFKLDYLYAGALPGARKEAVTGTSALTSGLVALRAAMGTDAIFEACGAPIFSVIGAADVVRVGTDTAFKGVSLTWSNVVFAARSTSARSFLSQAIFIDGDQTQVRSPFSLDEAKSSAFVAAMSGPAYSLGDDLTKLPAERLSIATDSMVLDLAGAASPAGAEDPLESPAETIVRAPVLDTISAPNSTTAPPPSRFTMKGASGTTYTLTFDWLDTHTVTVTK